MQDDGHSVALYHPLRWYNVTRMNQRTHRKLLVVDGRVGFTGGVGIADHWLGDAQSPEHWRESHYRVEGPAVAQMQRAFIDNWIKTKATVLFGERYFPPLAPVGDLPAQMFTSSRGEGSESVRLMYLLSIASPPSMCGCRRPASSPQRDKARSRLIPRAEFTQRSAIRKVIDELAGMLRRQL